MNPIDHTVTLTMFPGEGRKKEISPSHDHTLILMAYSRCVAMYGFVIHIFSFW